MSIPRVLGCVIALLVLGLAACHGDRPASHPLSGSSGAPTPAPIAARPAVAPIAARPTAPPAVQAQIDRGRALFARNCTACHGSRGEGSARAPALIGAGTLPLSPPPGRRIRTGRFQTAMELGMFIKDNMPYRGTRLPPPDVACVLAWLLQEHGLTPTQPISPATAGAIRLH